MNRRRFTLKLLVVWVAVTGALSPAGAVEPFAESLAMKVIDPAYYDGVLARIQAFDRILVPSIGGQIYISFDAAKEGPGILVLDAESLAVVNVHWAEQVGLDPSDRWLAGTLMPSGANALFCTSAAEAAEEQPTVKLVRISTNRDTAPRVSSLTLPEVPAAIAPIRDHGQLLVLTRPSNFAVRVDPITNEVVSVNRDIFPFIPYDYPPGRCLEPLANGQIYGSFKGRLFAYLPPTPPPGSRPSGSDPVPGHSPPGSNSAPGSPEPFESSELSDPPDAMDTSEDEFFAYLGLLPCEYGHLSQVALSAAASDGEGTLVGGTAAGGYLFTVDTNTQEVKPWGRPTDGTEIRARVHAGTTGISGWAVKPDQTTHTFNFRPDERVLKDHGVPAGSLEQDGRQWTWHAHRVADMAVLPDGRILLAERANQAKLLVFEPPPQPTEATDASDHP